MKKIRKMYSGVVPNGKVLNSRNDSLQDTYSSDYLNRNIPNTKDLGEIIVDDITCKNLLPNYMQSQTVNGVIITKNNDGSITFNGTSTAAIRLTFRINLSLSSGQYTHSIKNAVPTGSYLSLDNIDYTMIQGTTEGNKITFTLTKETTFSQYIIYFDPNITFNNVTIFPQVEKGNETNYVEHKEFSNKQIYDVSQSKVSECLFIKKDNIVFAHGWFVINGTSKTFTAPFKPASKNVWFPVVGLNTEQTPMSYGRALFNTDGTITITMAYASTYATAGFTYLTNE